MSDETKVEPSSFRDNFGNVFYYNERVIRTVNSIAKKNYEFIRDSQILFNPFSQRCYKYE